ncbi:MAG: outer membrane beta-barrel protein, partial [Betaproteobacteria bacterium]|nr:outer membrane beta-barrel protein [Betaproteobacteria bacterium]
ATAVTPAGSNTLKEVTLTVGYAPVKNFELRGELRADHADKGVFLDNAGLPQTSMSTVGVQGIYKF